MSIDRTATIVFGMFFGDEGKGKMVDYLCEQKGASLVVRYNGGSQAAHNVVVNGKHHTFSQFGAGTFAGARTLLSRFMMVDPISLWYEAQILHDKVEEFHWPYIDVRAPVITPFHAAANRIKSAGKNNTCGKGIGELAYDLIHHPDEVIIIGDLNKNTDNVRDKLHSIRKRKCAEIGKLDYLLKEQEILLKLVSVKEILDFFNIVSDHINFLQPNEVNKMIRESTSVFEGAQGILLDERYGFHPYTTWSNTLPTNAIKLLNEARFAGEVEKVGVLRTYMTRHGEGPLPTEYENVDENENHNTFNPWQGKFREGFLDLPLLRYSNALAKPTVLALTHVDKYKKSLWYCEGYRGFLEPNAEQATESVAYLYDKTEEMLTNSASCKYSEAFTFEELKELLKEQAAPVKYASSGPER